MDITERLVEVNAEAQRRFAEMIDAHSAPYEDAPETKAYRSAERLLDALLGDIQWETAKAAMDALIAADVEGADPVTRAKSLADGDHYAGMDHLPSSWVGR